MPIRITIGWYFYGYQLKLPKNSVVNDWVTNWTPSAIRNSDRHCLKNHLHELQFYVAYLQSQLMWEDKCKKWSVKSFTWYVSDHDFGIRISVWDNKALLTKEQWKSRTSSNLLPSLLAGRNFLTRNWFFHELYFYFIPIYLSYFSHPY
jgi:hypothetical protein